MRATLKKHMKRRANVDLDTCELWVDVSVGIENDEIPVALQRFLEDVTQVYDPVIYLASGGCRVGVLGKLHRGHAANKTPLVANVVQTKRTTDPTMPCASLASLLLGGRTNSSR
jgi:hypothetical protein